jgi:hypothetical protein
MIAVFMPATMTISIGDSKFTPGRIAISLLLLPALFLFSRRGGRLTASDVFVFAASAWMIAAQLWEGRYGSISSTVAEILEFSGGYMFARAYFFGRPALHCFIQVLKIVAILIIAFAALEHFSGSNLIANAVAAIWGNPSVGPEYRNDILRAWSTFPHAILYGTFCTIAGAIFLYSESKRISRIFYVGFCFAGCVLAVSSAPLILFSVAIAVYFYDHIMRRYSWRWKVLVVLIGGALVAVFLIADRPTSWVIAHLTLDPSTGYFRKGTWDRALYNIDLSPMVGYGFDAFGDPDELFDNVTIDSVWLVLALRFGVPVVILTLLAIAMSFMPAGRRARVQGGDDYLNNLGTAFTLALVVFSLAGLTVHFWHAIWIFWGICLGIRVGLRERYFIPMYPLTAGNQSPWGASISYR